MLVRAIRGDYKPAHKTIKVPVISPTVLQWTGARPWMDLVQRALVWEAREVDVYVNIFFGFPFADVPDVGMTVQVLTNDNPDLAEQVARDLADMIWRLRAALLQTTRLHSMMFIDRKLPTPRRISSQAASDSSPRPALTCQAIEQP